MPPKLGDREPTGIVVEVLDLTAQLDEAKARLQSLEDESKERRRVIDVTHRDLWGRVRVGDEVYCLCSEGTGSSRPVSDEYPLEVAFWGRYLADGEREVLEVYPRVTRTLNKDEVLDLPVKEKIPLEKFIRQFGKVLEENYMLWKRLFAEVETT